MVDQIADQNAGPLADQVMPQRAPPVRARPRSTVFAMIFSHDPMSGQAEKPQRVRESDDIHDRLSASGVEMKEHRLRLPELAGINTT